MWGYTVQTAVRQELYRDDELVYEPPLDQTTYTDSGLSPNRRYEYRIVLQLEDGSSETVEAAAVTLAHPPVVAGPMNVTQRGFMLAIVDESNPRETTYRVTVSDGSDTVSIDWDTSRCRTFEGLRTGEEYRFEVVARNLDGIETEPVRWLNSQAPQESEAVWTQRLTGTDDPWLVTWIDAAAALLGVTERARTWMLSDVYVATQAQDIGSAWYHSAFGIRISPLLDTAGLIHEMTHGFWDNWDGWTESCDVMNVYTFRRDIARFMLDFKALDESGGPNPSEDWRIFYNYLVGLLETYPPGRDSAWTLLAQGRYDELWGHFFHGAEASILFMVAGKPSLLPPPLRPYFSGFLAEEEETTWHDEIRWFNNLTPQDRYLWELVFPYYYIIWENPDLDRPPHQTRTSIPESTRKRLRDSDRRMLVDFVNRLDRKWCADSCQPLWQLDPDSWTFYVLDLSRRVRFYLDELSPDIGVELDRGNLDSVKGVLRVLVEDLACGQKSASSARELVNSTVGISELQREAFLQMIEVYEAASDRVTCDPFADDV